jgi:N-ethylmaleimide reductase
MENCGYTQETTEKAIKENQADLIAFGRLFISNPDFVNRFRNDCPLALDAGMSVWFDLIKEGYADFNFYNDEL